MKNMKKTLKERKIRKRKNNHTHKQTGGGDEWLTICKNPTICISFAQYREDIERYFDYFSWTWARLQNIVKIGSDSVNGFNCEIPFERNQYRAYAVLKSSRKESSDNLFYEALVGDFINTLHQYYPCFVQTYRYGKYKTATFYSDVKDNLVNPSILKRWKDELIMKRVSGNATKKSNKLKIIETSCKTPLYNCILIESIHPAASLYSECMKHKDSIDFWTKVFPHYLFQVYSVLTTISTQFTHYDLHSDNVLLYLLDDKKYIKMNYHFKHKTVSLMTNRILKIVDYGRSYFYQDQEINSNKIADLVCKFSSCNPECGKNKGYYWLNREHNERYDLRLLNDIYKSIILEYDIRLPSYILDFLGNIEYKSTETVHKLNIRTIHDAFVYIQRLLKEETVVQYNNENYKDSTLLGELDVWVEERRVMVWKKAI